jgi:predicted DNA-binding WGR domain protein
MVFLTRIDPARKLQRFWLARVTPTLLGGWTLVREWGRIGSPGTVSNRTFDLEKEASSTGGEARHQKTRAPRLPADPRCCVALVGSHGGWRKYSRPEKRLKNKSKRRDYSANDNRGVLDF